MANYVIEGTVSEITADKMDNFSFKILGVEGYSIKHSASKYNVLCPMKLYEEINKDNKIHLPCIVVSQDYQYSILEKNKALLVSFGALGRTFRFVIDIDENEKLSKLLRDKNKPIKIESVSLLLA